MDPEKWSKFDENSSKEQVMEILAAVVSNFNDGINGILNGIWFDLYRMGVYI